MLPAQYSCCQAMCLRLAWLESNSHDVIALSFGEVLCVVSSLASVKCSGAWERDWGYCLGAVGWDAVILVFCFLLFRAMARNDKQTMEGLGLTGGTLGFDEVIRNSYTLQKLQGGHDISVSLCTRLQFVNQLWVRNWCNKITRVVNSYSPDSKVVVF